MYMFSTSYQLIIIIIIPKYMDRDITLIPAHGALGFT